MSEPSICLMCAGSGITERMDHEDRVVVDTCTYCKNGFAISKLMSRITDDARQRAMSAAIKAVELYKNKTP